MNRHDMEECRVRLEAGDSSAMADALALACAAEEVVLPRWLADAVLTAYGNLQVDESPVLGRLLDILDITQPAQVGDALHQYLRRGCLDMPIPVTARVHEASCTAVFPITDPVGGLCSLLLADVGEQHRPTDPGSVALTELAAPLEGAAIRLIPPWLGEVGVAVGWESALCAWAGSSPPIPTDAVLNSDALASYQWPANVRRMVIFARSHEMEQAHALARRAKDAGLTVRWAMPSLPGWTWLDEYVFSKAVPADELSESVASKSEANDASGVM